MMKSQNSAIGRSHVVWLDVVRFVACLPWFVAIVQIRLTFIRVNHQLISIRLSSGEQLMDRFSVLVSPCL